MPDNNQGRRYFGLGSFFSMLAGGLLMVILVVSFSKSVAPKDDVVKKQTRIIKMKNTKKEIVKKEKPKAKAKKKQKNTAKAEPPDLGSIIGGIEMNIPEFAAGSIDGDARELLDDIAQDTVMNEDTVDKKPKVSYRAPMEYPSSAAEKGIQGYVVLNLLIAKDGSVKLAKILEAEPQGVFENTVLNSIRDWRFAPAKYKNQPVQVWVKQKVSFNT